MRLTIISLFTILIASCVKETPTVNMPIVPDPNISKLGLYEIYYPSNSNNIKHELYVQTMNILKDESSQQLKIDNSIAIIEGCMNSYFIDSLGYPTSADDTIIGYYSLTLDENERVNSHEINEVIRQTYNDTKRTLEGISGCHINVLDLCVKSLTNKSLHLELKAYYNTDSYIKTKYIWPNVPSSQDSRYAGASATCNMISGDGAWEFVEWQVKQTLPPRPYPLDYNQYSPTFNVTFFNSDPGAAGVYYMNGYWMLGQVNALFQNHQVPVPILTCVSPYEQDAYSNHLKVQLANVIDNHPYWDAVSCLRIKNSAGNGISVTSWYFDGVFSFNPIGEAENPLLPLE